jgi:hypothetical protein
MISEVVNTLFLTYLASEYLVADDGLPSSRRSSTSRVSASLLVAGGIVLLINFLDRVTGAKEVANDALQGFLHLPRILFAATAYILALYVDVRYRRGIPLTGKVFATKVGWAFCKVLPAYPFLAVLMSFVFLFVISLWEALHLPMEWLNAPIYYGTLYGPFAWVYVHVKRQICQEATSLPVHASSSW